MVSFEDFQTHPCRDLGTLSCTRIMQGIISSRSLQTASLFVVHQITVRIYSSGVARVIASEGKSYLQGVPLLSFMLLYFPNLT